MQEPTGTDSGNGGPQERLRSYVPAPWLYRLFTGLFAALFAGTFLLVLFANTHTFARYTWYWLLLAAGAGVLATWLLQRLFSAFPTPSRGTEATLVVLVLAVMAALQVFIGLQLRVDPSGQGVYGSVYTYAQDYALYRRLPDSYFLYRPGEAPLYLFWCGFFSLMQVFGLYEFFMPSLVLNIFCILLSVLLLYFCVRRLFGSKKSLFLLLVCLFLLPLYLYVPLFGPETLTLPVPVGMVLIWLRTRQRFREGRVGRAVGGFFGLSLLGALGGLLKLTVMVVWVAIVLDLLILLRGSGRVRMLLAGVATAGALLAGGLWLATHNSALPVYDYSNGVPWTQNIMMGLRGRGDVNEEDVAAVLAAGETKAGRSRFVNEEIQSRLSAQGPLGVLQQLGTKLSYAYNDGLYAAPGELGREPARLSPLHYYVLPGQNGFRPLAHYAFAMQAALLFWMVVAAVKAMVRKNYALTFVRVAVFGLTLFLLVWTANPRYLLNVLPLLMLGALEAAPVPVSAAQRRHAMQAHLSSRFAPLPPLPEEGDAPQAPDAPPAAADGPGAGEMWDLEAEADEGFFLPVPEGEGQQEAPQDAGMEPVPPPSLFDENAPSF